MDTLLAQSNHDSLKSTGGINKQESQGMDLTEYLCQNGCLHNEGNTSFHIASNGAYTESTSNAETYHTFKTNQW